MKIMKIKTCKICKREFEANYPNKIICNSCLNGDQDSIFKCKMCGKPIPYNRTFCSNSCNSKYNFQIANIHNPFRDKDIQSRIHQKLQDEYYNNPEAKEKLSNKAKDTWIQKYGSLQNFYEERQIKIEQTNLERYGVKCSSQNEDVKLKNLQTKIEHYGNLEEANKQSKLKREQTCIRRYGVENASKTDEIKNKIKETWINNYGSIKEAHIQASIKSKETSLRKYNKEHYNQTDEYKERVKEKYIQRLNTLGYSLPIQDNYNDAFKKLLYNKEESIKFLQDNYKKFSLQDLAQYFECGLMSIINWIKRFNLQEYIQYHNGSQYEKQILNELIDKDKFKLHCKVLDKQEIDIYSEELKLGIEFNGNYWHSDLNKEKNYHYNKSKLAEEKGIRLIHIYEYEWKDERIRPILLSLLNITTGNLSKKIYARNCEVREINNKIAKPFNNKNHLQGHRNAQVTYGLYYKDELVQLMSFSKTKYNKNLKEDNAWEIIRGCPGSNNIVIGGVSKLFKYFIKQHNPNIIFSYCDFNKFDGRSYEAISMKFIGYTGPNKVWLIDNQGVNRQPSKYKELKEKSEAIIWGSGSKKYLWRKENE